MWKLYDLLLSLGIDYRPGMMVGNSEPLLLSVPLIFFFRGMEQPRAVESPASLPRLLRLKWNSSYIPLRKTGREKELMSDIKQGSLMVNHIPPGRSKMRLIQSQDTYTDFALERLLCEFFFDCLPSSLLVSS